MRKEPETQASSDMERVRLRVYTVLYTRKTAVKDAAGAAQRAEILDGRIFPSPAPRKVPERGFFTWSGSRRKNPRRKLPLTWRGFGCGCTMEADTRKTAVKDAPAPALPVGDP